MDANEFVGNAPQAFLALAVFGTGQPGDALRVALSALAKTLPVYEAAVKQC